MAAGLLVDADQIGSGLFYISHVPARLLHHHMNIEHLVCHWPQLLDHRHSKGNAGHKSPVHDIQMDILRSRISYGPYFLSQPGKIGCQYGWR